MSKLLSCHGSIPLGIFSTRRRRLINVMPERLGAVVVDDEERKRLAAEMIALDLGRLTKQATANGMPMLAYHSGNGAGRGGSRLEAKGKAAG